MVIWLTGCTAGLGKALLKEFCTEKNVIVGGGRRLERLAELSKVYQNAYFFELDVEHQESVEKFCEKAMNTTGAPDILINNAAMINAREKLWNISTEDFDQLTNINLNGVARMIRSTVPEMIKRGSGIIVNLSSGWGRSTSPGVAPYCASKWAIEGLTQAMAQELPSGIAPLISLAYLKKIMELHSLFLFSSR